MRDTSDRQLQLDFQRRAPEPCNDCSDLSARASSAFHDARPTSVHAAWFRCGVFFRLETVATLTSGAPRPLPRQRVNAAGFNASSGYLRSAHAAASLALGFRQHQLGSFAPAVSRNRRQTRPNTTTLTNFCNRRKARAHWRSDRYPAPSRFSRHGVAPCGAPAALAHRPFSSRVSAVQGTEAGSRL